MIHDMKAIFYMGKNTLEVRDTEKPGLEEDRDVIVQVKYAGICGTDLSIMAGKHPRAKRPLIMGHEFSGTVHEAGTNVSGMQAGDRIVVEPLISCGTCYACRSGYAYVCQNLGLYGIDAPGAFAEFVKVPAEKVFSVPDDIDYDIAALIEPMAVAVHAIRLSNLKVGDVVCVQGAGPIGLLTALVAQQSGSREVIICEKESYRCDIAHTFTPKQ